MRYRVWWVRIGLVSFSFSSVVASVRWWWRWGCGARSLRFFLYLDNVWCCAQEGLVSIGSANLKVLFRFLQLVCQLGDAVDYLLLQRLQPLSLICYVTRSGFLNPLFWGVHLADVLSVVARSYCRQRVVFAVFKVLCGDGVCWYLFPLLPFHCFFQAPVDGTIEWITRPENFTM